MTRSWPGIPTMDDATQLQLELSQWLGGEPGVSAFDKLETTISAVASGRYSSPIDQAADLLRGFALNRCFFDGNKRMAIALTARFLAANGRKLQVSDAESRRFVIEVMTRRMGVAPIAEWLDKHSR